MFCKRCGTPITDTPPGTPQLCERHKKEWEASLQILKQRTRIRSAELASYLGWSIYFGPEQQTVFTEDELQLISLEQEQVYIRVLDQEQEIDVFYNGTTNIPNFILKKE